MRMTESLRQHDLLRNIQNSAWQLGRVYEKLATQRDINRPSDDPGKTGTLIRTSAYVEALEQESRSIERAITFMDTGSIELEACLEKAQSVRTLAIQACNATLSPHDRESLAVEVDQLLEALVQSANQTHDGRYIFSGTATDTGPFSVTRDADGEIESVTYEGSATPLQFPIGRGRRVNVSVTGQATFADSGMLSAAISLRDHLQNDDGLSEEALTAALQNDLQNLADSEHTLLSETGKLGARISNLDMMKDQVQTAITRAKEMVSELRDADMAQLAIDLSREEMVYQALLSASTRILNVSLLDYI